MNVFGHWREPIPARRLQIFVHDLSATGVVRNAIALGNRAAASGYQVRLLACNVDGVLRSEVGPGVAVVRLSGSGGGSRRMEMKRSLAAYRRHSREWAPDIMVSAGNHGHLLSTFAWLGLPGKKLLRFSNDLSHGTPSLPVRWWRAARFWMMAKLADRLIFVSRAQARHPLLARQLKAGKALIIPNGVDPESVRAAAGEGCDHPWAGDASIPLLLAVGRHVEQKNFRTLLRAFAIARAKRPMRLLFLGDGKAAELGRLKNLAGELGVEQDVAFVPAVSNPFPYMLAARAFVLPSLWEGSANVLLEAMACGTPVIASRTAGDAEHVLDSGKFGLLVDPHCADEIAEALLTQIGPEAIYPGIRASAFARERTMNDYIRLCDTLADGQTKPRRPMARTSAVAGA